MGLFYGGFSLKLILTNRQLILKVLIVLCLTSLSVVYSTGVSFKTLNAFLNTQKEIPIYCVETNEKKISLSFDIAWGGEYTGKILDILNENNVTATFFIVGSWADMYPETVKKISDMGFEIGNHSATHPHFTGISEVKMKEEIYKTSSKIEKITGKPTKLFRPPFGDYNSNVVKVTKETGHLCIQWDVDSLDWTEPGTEVIYKRVMEKTGNGSILLFHNKSEQTTNVLDRIIKDLKKEGYSFVKISDLVYKDNFYIDHLGRQKSSK